MRLFPIFHKSALLLAALVAFVTARPATGQNGSQLHWGSPAAEIVRAFAAGEFAAAPAYAVTYCPNRNAYSDSIFQGLLRLEQTLLRVAQYMTYWSRALSECNDPRMDLWYRTQLAQRKDDATTFLLSRALLGHPTPDNLAALRAAALDTARTDEVRTYALTDLANSGKLGWEERVDLFAASFEHGGHLVEPYTTGEWYRLSNGPAVSAFRLRSLEVLERNAGKDGAAQFLAMLMGDANGSARADGRFQAALRQTVARLRGNPSASASVRKMAAGADEPSIH